MESTLVVEQSDNVDIKASMTRGEDSVHSKRSEFECERKSESFDETSNPYAYLERDEFTSEKFKIEIRGLPKFYGIAVCMQFFSS